MSSTAIGMSCISPFAPAPLPIPGSPPDSWARTAATRAESTPATADHFWILSSHGDAKLRRFLRSFAISPPYIQSVP
jgi:hypothetical protein